MSLGRADNWPWSELGIAETPDKAAIHAAYAERRAALDTSMRISAFAKLTEAREKALFLASEMRREAERRAHAEEAAVEDDVAVEEPEPPSPVETPDVPPSDEVLGPAPEAFPQDAPEPDVTEPDEPSLPEPTTTAPPPAPAQPPVETPAADVDPPAPPASEPQTVYVDPSYDNDWTPPSPSSGEQWSSDGRPTPFVERYELRKYGAWWVVGFLFLVWLSLPGDEPDELAPPPEQPEIHTEADEVLESEPTPESSQDDTGPSYGAEQLVDELFGPEVDYADLASGEYQLRSMIDRYRYEGEAGLQEARAAVRRRLLELRYRVSRDDLEAISRMHLVWLRSAQAQSDDHCREVTDRAFFDGVPQLSPEDLALERDLVRRVMLRKRHMIRGVEPVARSAPAWAYALASEGAGLSEETIRKAMSDLAHPDRCSASIALLEAFLTQPDNIPVAAFLAI